MVIRHLPCAVVRARDVAMKCEGGRGRCSGQKQVHKILSESTKHLTKSQAEYELGQRDRRDEEGCFL